MRYKKLISRLNKIAQNKHFMVESKIGSFDLHGEDSSYSYGFEDKCYVADYIAYLDRSTLY